VHELDRDQTKITKELLDIATRHASSEEAVRTVFIQGDGKMVPGGSRGAPPKATGKCDKRSAKGSKKGQKRRPLWVRVTTSCDNDDGKKADGSDEEHVVAAESNFKRQARLPNDHFKKSPNHTYRTKDKIKKCTMIKNYMISRDLAKGKKSEGDPGGKAVAPFPGEEVVMSVYDGPIPHESHRKLTSRAVTCDQIAHQDCVPKRGRFPPHSRSASRMYLDTFEGLGLGQDLLQNSLHPFYGVVLDKQSI
jgi:hypothetical protein